MALSFDLTGLPMLENEVAQLVAQQAVNPSSFTGGQTFTTTFKSAVAGNPVAGLPAGTMTISQLIARLQALLLIVTSLPQ